MDIDALAEARPRPGDTIRYVLSIENGRYVSDRRLALALHLSDGMQLGRIDGGPPRVHTSAGGQTVELTPIEEIRPGEVIQLEVQARAWRRGDAVLRAELTSRGLTHPLVAQERVRVE
jgi:hypothetical protein